MTSFIVEPYKLPVSQMYDLVVVIVSLKDKSKRHTRLHNGGNPNPHQDERDWLDAFFP